MSLISPIRSHLIGHLRSAHSLKQCGSKTFNRAIGMAYPLIPTQMQLHTSNSRLGSRYSVRGLYTSLKISSPSTATKPISSSPAREQEPAQAGVDVELPESNADETRVAIGWPDGIWSRYHHFWLRDHCRCPECFHPITRQRMVDTFALPPGLYPKEVISKKEGLEVTWPTSPPHVSMYPWQWLRQNSYDPKTIPITIAGVSPHPEPEPNILWGSGIVRDPPTMTYNDVMKDEMAVLKWLEKIERFGFCFVTGVPATTEDTEKLVRRINIIRHTQYGGFWDFTSDLAHGDTAYTNIALPAHTDNSYYTDPCGLQIFHLLSHEAGAGGQTLLVDGFYVASILKELQPESYDLLSSVKIPTYHAGDEEFIYQAKPGRGNPILQHDPDTGELVQIRYANDHRGAMGNIEPSLIIPWYQALRHWNECLKSADSEYWLQLTAGTVVVINNHRVLHGRSAFTGKRRMCGAYVGADDWIARLEALREKYNRRDGKERSVWDSRF